MHELANWTEILFVISFKLHEFDRWFTRFTVQSNYTFYQCAFSVQSNSQYIIFYLLFNWNFNPKTQAHTVLCLYCTTDCVGLGGKEVDQTNRQMLKTRGGTRANRWETGVDLIVSYESECFPPRIRRHYNSVDFLTQFSNHNTKLSVCVCVQRVTFISQNFDFIVARVKMVSEKLTDMSQSHCLDSRVTYW